jgi:hypothetical protein
VSVPLPATKNRIKAEFQPILAQLREKLSEREIALALGVSRPTLRRAKIDVSTARLAWLLWRIIDRPHKAIHMFDLLTLGQYELTPQDEAMLADETPQGNLQQIKQFPENQADLSSIHKTIDTLGDYQI